MAGIPRATSAALTLTSHQVTVLDVYGSLFYAGARTLHARLPRVADAQAPAVILRLRGRTTLGATFFSILGESTWAALHDAQAWVAESLPRPILPISRQQPTKESS